MITATLAGTEGLSYLHGLTIQNEKQSEDSNGKIDVWDFGGAELDSNVYNNRLTADVINGFYDSSIAAGSGGNVAPSSFSAGNLSWVGGINDRIRTSNEAITRYDTCLLYTSDAADEEDSVDLGGSRIIKKKKKEKKQHNRTKKKRKKKNTN